MKQVINIRLVTDRSSGLATASSIFNSPTICLQCRAALQYQTAISPQSLARRSYASETLSSRLSRWRNPIKDASQAPKAVSEEVDVDGEEELLDEKEQPLFEADSQTTREHYVPATTALGLPRMSDLVRNQQIAQRIRYRR